MVRQRILTPRPPRKEYSATFVWQCVRSVVVGNRGSSVATDPRIEEYLSKNPLIVFSVYTDTQYKIVQSLGQDIIRCLEETISVGEGGIPNVRLMGEFTNDAYAKFWLWILGAYEVVRTMSQAKTCFTAEILKKLEELKQTLAFMRMPFAKQEPKGVKGAVSAELSIWDISASPPDYRFRIDGQVFSVRELIGRFNEVLGSIKRDDILARHQDSYSAGGNDPSML